MSAFGKSQTVKRFEDVRFLTGQGRYIDDTAPADALHAVFVRSPHAHADIVAIDTAAARAMPGVAAVLTSADLKAAKLRLDMGYERIKQPDGRRGTAPKRPTLAIGRVRFVGEPVVAVVADTLAAARDAAEAVAVDYAELDVSLAVEPGQGPAIHPEAPDNVAFDWHIGDRAAVDAAFKRAAHVVRLPVHHNRIIANSMEPRGAWAEWTADGRVHVAISSQSVWDQKSQICRLLRLPEDAVRVTTPDVGGGFGMKGMAYPEYAVIAQAARVTGRPVRWMSERTEAMLTDNAGRDLTAVAELAFDADHRILGYRVDVLSNLGAYNSGYAQFIQSELFAKVFTGTYAMPVAFLRARGIYTNTAQVDAYRGAGRPEAIMTLERVMDTAARTLGVDPWALRQKNFITKFPHKTVAGSRYDVGDFPRVLARVRAEADAEGFGSRRDKAAKAGKLRGMGICYYIESILGDRKEAADIAFEADGTVSLLVGTQSNGQGHETVYAQFLSDRTGIPADRIRVVQGDSDLIAWGGGTGGSRSVTVQSNATLGTVSHMIATLTPFAAAELASDAGEVAFEDGAFRAKGTNRFVGLLDLVERARAAGRTDLLRHRKMSTLPARSFPNGCHVAEVEVDPETGKVDVLRYTVTDDFGNLMHPTLVEGQIHGGVAQGIGQVLMEDAVYDASGQLLTATFMDYAMPRADDVPMIAFSTEPTPSTTNVFGMKGCGEAGTVGALAAVSNAVLDALWPLGVRHVDVPLRPVRVWQMIRDARAKGAAA
jgi:carbon-monoxide dehydrogenase large subunit